MTSVAFVVNGDQRSPMGYRARAFATRLVHYEVFIAYRSRNKVLAILGFFVFLVRLRPKVSYVFDISYSGVLGAGIYRLIFRNCLVIETGDAIVDLVRSTGSRGKIGIWLTAQLENAAFRMADRIVVRGSFHQELLALQGIDADVIQDGVDTESFVSEDVSDLRKEYGLAEVLTVGLVGSSIWSEKLQMCYGWDLVETLSLLRGKPVKGIMIGSGSGISHLQARSHEHGIEDKIVFLGHVPYEQLNRYLQLIDVCLSTQSNDIVGKVRTTGKLPLYLAAGRYILASNVGEAALVLDKEMLVDYDGVNDQGYPQKLKERIDTILDHPEILERAVKNFKEAREHFDYSLLAKRMKQVIDSVIERRLTRQAKNATC